MDDPITIGGFVVLLVLFFLRFGNTLTEYICRTLDPAPDLIDEYQP